MSDAGIAFFIFAFFVFWIWLIFHVSKRRINARNRAYHSCRARGGVVSSCSSGLSSLGMIPPLSTVFSSGRQGYDPFLPVDNLEHPLTFQDVDLGGYLGSYLDSKIEP